MPPLTRDQVLAADDLDREEVEVPEWGGSVFVRGLDGAEREQNELAGYQLGKGDVSKIKHLRARTVAWCVTDEAGNRIFAKAEEVLKKSGNVINRLYDRIVEKSGMAKDAEDDAAKNSSDPSGDSGSS